MRDKLGAHPVAVTIPVGQGQDFAGLIDSAHPGAPGFRPEDPGRDHRTPAPDRDEATLAAPWREKLVEAACEHDDVLMEAYLSGEDIARDRLVAGLRAATLAHAAVPVYAASALKNIGVQPLLDGVLAFLPSPLDRGAVAGLDPAGKLPKSFEPDPSAPLAALVFKVSMETGRRQVFVRVYSGTLTAGQDTYNAIRDKIERPARLFTLHASHREKIETAGPGEIVAVAGLRFAATGDTLCTKADPIVLEAIAGYKPVISLALEPRNAEESDRLKEVLDKLLQEDPTLSLVIDPETEQMVLSGMGELHLDVVLERARREYGVAPRVGKPQWFTWRPSTAWHRARRVRPGTGGKEHYGKVAVSVAPCRVESAGKSVLPRRQAYRPLGHVHCRGLETGCKRAVRGIRSRMCGWG